MFEPRRRPVTSGNTGHRSELEPKFGVELRVEGRLQRRWDYVRTPAKAASNLVIDLTQIRSGIEARQTESPTGRKPFLWLLNGQGNGLNVANIRSTTPAEHVDA